MKNDAREKITVALCGAGEIYGGVEEWIFTFVDQAQKHGVPIETVVILFYEGPLAKKLREAGVCVCIPTRKKYDLAARSRIKTFLKEAAVQVVHTHGYLATVLCAPAARALGIPVIKTEHSIIEPCANAAHIIAFARMHLNHFLDRHVTRRACQMVVYVSHFAKEHIQPRYGTLPHAVIPNGIVFHQRDPAFECGFNPHHCTIGIVGRLSTVKGHRYLFAALEKLIKAKTLPKRPHLHVFGDGSLKDELWSLCGELGIHDHVTFHGFRNHIDQYIACLDLFVMPSIFESMPYALLEAMYAKCPVVVSRVGGMREVIEDGITGRFCEAKDPDSLADAIAAALTNPEQSKQIARAAHEKILSDYSIQTMISRYVTLYEQARKG